MLVSVAAFLLGLVVRLAVSGSIGNTSQWGIVVSPCAWCGKTNEIEVHHIYPQHLWPERKWDKKNMICLCRECHYVLGHRKNWMNVVTNLILMIKEGRK